MVGRLRIAEAPFPLELDLAQPFELIPGEVLAQPIDLGLVDRPPLRHHAGAASCPRRDWRGG